MTEALDNALQRVGQIILGKEDEILLSFCCLLAKGHLLIEDLPGMGKTTLSHAIANVLGLDFQRIQFTSDLLPADILGASIYDRENSKFIFQPGPIFSQILLIDEVNRATPKTQSAMLEAMEERQVTIEGETRQLPNPFFVIATQNPHYQLGTFPLPESQLDRFLMRISLGYPEAEDEKLMLQGEDRRVLLRELSPCLSIHELESMQEQVKKVFVSNALIEYVQGLVHATRTSDVFEDGLSPRGALALLNGAKAWSFIQGREHVMPEDVQKIFGPVITHRLKQKDDHEKYTMEQLTERILSTVPVV